MWSWSIGRCLPGCLSRSCCSTSGDGSAGDKSWLRALPMKLASVWLAERSGKRACGARLRWVCWRDQSREGCTVGCTQYDVRPKLDSKLCTRHAGQCQVTDTWLFGPVFGHEIHVTLFGRFQKILKYPRIQKPRGGLCEARNFWTPFNPRAVTYKL